MWIFEELRSIQEISYRYDDEQSPEDLVESLADELAPAHPLPPERLLERAARVVLPGVISVPSGLTPNLDVVVRARVLRRLFII